MKYFLVIALSAAFVLAAVAAPAEEADASKCKLQPTCPLLKRPVCGYDGNCYKIHENDCLYELEKCRRNNNLETVDLSLCELADKNNHPNYKTCPE